jgi:hypothetical protein
MTTMTANVWPVARVPDALAVAPTEKDIIVVNEKSIDCRAVNWIEKIMLRAVLEKPDLWTQPEIKPVHRFAKGLYSREITIPANAFATGVIHKTQHLNVMSRGCVSVWSQDEGLRLLRAPFIFVAQPGTRRAGYIHEEMTWTTVFGTDETDLEKLKEELVFPYENPLLSDDEKELLLVW